MKKDNTFIAANCIFTVKKGNLLHACTTRIPADINMFGQVEAIAAATFGDCEVITLNVCASMPKANALAKVWNDSFKKNGQYLPMMFERQVTPEAN